MAIHELFLLTFQETLSDSTSSAADTTNTTSVQTNNKRQSALEREESRVRSAFSGAGSCAAKMWRCVGGAVADGMDYVNRPGGFGG